MTSSGRPIPHRVPCGGFLLPGGDVGHAATGPATLSPVTHRLAPATAARVAAAAAVAAGSLALSGCATLSPVQTDKNVLTAAGVPVDLGAVQVRDLLVVTSAKGSPGVVVAQIVNTGSYAATVRFSVASQSTSGGDVVRASVPAGGSTSLATGATEVVLPAVPAEPGSMVTLDVQTSDSGSTPVDVPVLAPDSFLSGQTPASS